MQIRTHLFLSRLAAELTKPAPVFWRSIAPELAQSDPLYIVDNSGVINLDGSMTLKKVNGQVYGPEMPLHRFQGETLQKVRLARYLKGHRLYLETHMTEMIEE